MRSRTRMRQILDGVSLLLEPHEVDQKLNSASHSVMEGEAVYQLAEAKVLKRCKQPPEKGSHRNNIGDCGLCSSMDPLLRKRTGELVEEALADEFICSRGLLLSGRRIVFNP